MASSIQRTFAKNSPEDISALEERSYAKKTEYSINSAEKIFKAFLQSKNLLDIPSCRSELNLHLKEFWPSLRTLLNGEEYRASSLFTLRQNLRLFLQRKIGVDIIADPDMSNHVVFDNYIKTLKKRGKGYVEHHKEVKKEDLQIIRSKLNSDVPQQLQWLAWINIQLHLCRRGLENTHSMKKSDLIVETHAEQTFIRMKNAETKNHKEINEDYENGGVISNVPGNPSCPVTVITSYLNRLNPACESLWQKPKATIKNPNDCWFQNSTVGHNTISNMMKNISQFCELQTSYTNHSLRVTSCTLLGEAGYDDLDIQAVSRHKSVSALGVYKRVKIDKKVEMSKSLSAAMGVLPPLQPTSINVTEKGNLPMELPSLSSTITHQDFSLSYGTSSSNIGPQSDPQSDISDWNDINLDQLLVQAAKKTEKTVQIQNFFSGCTFNGNFSFQFHSK
jgi:hypothetical protein